MLFINRKCPLIIHIRFKSKKCKPEMRSFPFQYDCKHSALDDIIINYTLSSYTIICRCNNDYDDINQIGISIRYISNGGFLPITTIDQFCTFIANKIRFYWFECNRWFPLMLFTKSPKGQFAFNIHFSWWNEWRYSSG